MFAEIETRLSGLDPVLSGIELTSLVFLLVMASETVWDLFSGYRHSWKETGANILIGLVYGVLDRFLFGLILVLGVFVAEPLAFANIPINWWSWPLAVLAADLTYYWMHRCEHRIRLLWTYHSVHHSSPEFNFTTALRLAWIEAFFVWMFFVPMVLIGFDPVQVIGGLAIVVAYQSWIHTQKIGRLGFLENILNTPSNHRVHHACNPDYIDKNYGGILILWDQLFGTYAAERAAPKFGITEPVNSSNPLTINFRDTIRLFKDVFSSKSLRQAVKTMLMPPGWKPDETKDKD